MSLQGLTVAISPSGLQYFVNTLLAPEIATALKGLTVPDKTIDAGDILLGSYKGVGNWANNIVIGLSSGSLSNFTPTFQSLTQGSNGTFTMVLQASNVTVSYNWNEQYDSEQCYTTCTNLGHENNNYAYTMGIGTFTVTVTFQFVATSGTWGLQLVSAVPTTANLTPNIPSGSIVNLEEQSGCFSTTVSASTEQAVSQIDFSGAISSLLGPLFQSIPASGQLTPDIAFQFAMGPSGLAYPGDAGIATGVDGVATYQGTAYPGANPPQLAVPPVPTDEHLGYYVSDYTINSLFWAFYSQGLLQTLVTAGNIPDPQYLNTSNYNNTPLQALYNAYPNTPMTAGVKALAAPTVTFEQIYDLTALNMPSLQPPNLPQDVYNSLQGLSGQVYFDEPSFFTALVGTLGQTDADQYKTVIESAALVTAAVATHQVQVVLNVISGGQTIPVITFNVSETDVLQAFGLGITGTTQSLQFQFQIVPGATQTTFVSSTISGINSVDFGMIWNFVLQPVYATEAARMGQAGVALPRIQGFNFLFTTATVTLQPGYASVLTDVQHVSDGSQVKYLMSKRTIQHGESIVSPTAAARVRRVGPWKAIRPAPRPADLFPAPETAGAAG